MQPGRLRRLVTASVMLGMFLAALEATAVATAMPTAVGELGGLSRFSWVFSAYLLASTTTGPLYGKLADLYGRRRVYVASIGIFLLGSALCGVAGSIEQLILFRPIQGIGAGGVMPVGVTIIGDIFTLEERGRMQGLFSGVWAVASFVGPLLGGWSYRRPVVALDLLPQPPVRRRLGLAASTAPSATSRRGGSTGSTSSAR